MVQQRTTPATATATSNQQFFYGKHYGIGAATAPESKGNRWAVQLSCKAGLAKLSTKPSPLRVGLTKAGLVFRLGQFNTQEKKTRAVAYKDIRMVSKLPNHPAAKGATLLSIAATDTDYESNGNRIWAGDAKVITFLWAPEDEATCASFYTQLAMHMLQSKSIGLQRSKRHNRSRSIRSAKAAGGPVPKPSDKWTHAPADNNETAADSSSSSLEYPTDLFDHCQIETNGEEIWAF